jgi:hypothetical protein
MKKVVPKWYRNQRDGGQTATSSFYFIIQIQIVLISEIEDVSRYVVPYTGKRHSTSQAKIDTFQKHQHEVSEHMT